jgi:L-asparagine oxygenase
MTVQLRHFTDEQRIRLTQDLRTITHNPYSQYYEFKDEVKDLIQTLPDFIYQLCKSIVSDRKTDERVHFIRNCPIDVDVEKFDPINPSADKYQKKKTFIGETFLQVFAELTETPIFRYDFSGGIDNQYFMDVYGVINHKVHHNLNFQELVLHGDDSDHKIMPDYINLLGMRADEANLVSTSLIEVSNILTHLSNESLDYLRMPFYHIPQKDGSTNLQETVVKEFGILDDSNRLRYCSTRTQCTKVSPIEARDAFIDLHHAINKSNKLRIFIGKGDLLSFSNRHNLHSREIIKINDVSAARHRWLLKNFNFESIKASECSRAFFSNGESYVIRH